MTTARKAFELLDPSYHEAIVFATGAHRGQVRKFTGAPYINHPLRVAAAAEEHGLDAAFVRAAILHDVLEDTTVGGIELCSRFGPDVYSIVYALSDCRTRWAEQPAREELMLPWCPVHKPANRRERKSIDLHWLSLQAPEIRALKLLDMADNLGEISAADGFTPLYLDELRALADAIKTGVSSAIVAAFERAYAAKLAEVEQLGNADDGILL